MAAYEQTKINSLRRLPARGSYDYKTIHSLVNNCPVLHVSFNDDDAGHGFPVTLPMLGCMGNFENQSADPASSAMDVYIHGYVSGRLFRKAAGPSTEREQGLPMTVSATFIDGLILSLTPFHNSCNYRSAVVYGHATPVTDEHEALYAMKLITDNMLPGRWDGSRIPPSAAELKSTSILKVSVVGGSAKIRTGGPSEDRADLQDKGLREKCWTGAVPYWGTWGEPVEGKENMCKEVEGYIETWRQRETGKARGYAFDAIGMDGKAE